MEIQTSLENAAESLCENEGMTLQNAIYRPNFNRATLEFELSVNQRVGVKYLVAKQRSAWENGIALSYTMVLPIPMFYKDSEAIFERVDNANREELLSFIAKAVEQERFMEYLKITKPGENHTYPDTGFNLRRELGCYWLNERGSSGDKIELNKGVEKMSEHLHKRLNGVRV